VSAELEARRTAARAALADYYRAVDAEAQPNGPAVPWALWAGRLAAALGSVLAMVPEVADPDAAPKLAAIRAVLAGFDWEFHDRQLALEEIDRIAGGQQ
jgi:hypothetical protein